MILVIDNYDSFTYNLVQYIGSIVNEIEVKRNDRLSIDYIEKRGKELKINISCKEGLL